MYDNSIVIENLSRYPHQLYFFTEEATKVREYFQSLNKVDINDNNNDVQEKQRKYNYEELAQKICVLSGHSQHYKSILSMIKTKEALKVIVALLFKGFGWKNEIYEDFNIASNVYVQNTLSTLHNLDLLYKEKGVKINQIYFEALEKMKGNNLRVSLHQAELYFINEDFIKFCSLLTDLFESKAKRSKSFRFSIGTVVNDSKNFLEKLDEIMDEELNLNERKKISPDGIVYYTETIKSKQFKKDMKKAIAELKLERLEAKEKQNLLTDQEKGQLALVRQSNNALVLYQGEEEEDWLKKFKKTKKATITYNGEEVDEAQLMQKIAEKDKIIENTPLECGDLDVNQLKSMRKKFEKERSQFKIDEDEELAKAEALNKLIKSQKKVHCSKIDKNIRSPEIYNTFLDMCIDNGIKTDYEHFFLEERKTPEQEVEDVFKGLGVQL